MTEITQADRLLLADLFDLPQSKAMELFAGKHDANETIGAKLQALARHRMEERAAIVALAAEYMGDIEFAQFKHALNADDQFLDPNHYWYRQGKDDGIEQERGNTVEWLKKRAPAALHDPRMVADAIEAGEHLK